MKGLYYLLSVTNKNTSQRKIKRRRGLWKKDKITKRVIKPEPCAFYQASFTGPLRVSMDCGVTGTGFMIEIVDSHTSKTTGRKSNLILNDVEVKVAVDDVEDQVTIEKLHFVFII